MSHHNRTCRLTPIAETGHGRVLHCKDHPGFLLEFGPVIVRLRDNEFHDMANTVDQLADSSDEVCTSCTHQECRSKNFALDICSPRVTVEFHYDELKELQELLIEARLSLLLSQHQVERADAQS